MKFIKLFLALSILLSCNSMPAFAQATRDSIVCVDTTVKVTHVTYTDSTYQSCRTIQVPIPGTLPELHGFYVAYDAFTLGDQTSENTFLARMQALGVNMLNYYARAKLYASTDRDKLAAFVAKAKKNYGMVLITVDVRFTDSREYPGWIAYYQKYGNTTSMIEPLAEFEPYRLNSAGIYPYPDMFILLQKMDALTKQYGALMNWYEGWIGQHYSDKQAPVDSMVLHCGRIFVSNYVSMSRYTSSIWDGSMTNRIDQGGTDYGGITKAAKKFNKVIGIVEIQSIEAVFLQAYYTCPASTTNKCQPFFGQTFEATKAKYNAVSTTDVLKYTDLVGKTIFYTTLLPNTKQ